MNIWVWVLVVLVKADGVERDWNSYLRPEECLEIIKIITRHHEDQIQAYCELRIVDLPNKEEIR